MRKTKPAVSTFFLLLCLFIGLPAQAETQTDKGFRISIGGYGGEAFSVADNAIHGADLDGVKHEYPNTEFQQGEMYGGSLMFRFPNGIALEFSADRNRFDLDEGGTEMGTLELTPILALIKYQGLPARDSGFAGHAELGFGWALTKFELSGAAKRAGWTSVDTDDNYAFLAGMGIDYFLCKYVSLSTNARFLLVQTQTKWKMGENVDQKRKSFNANNVQVLFGLRFWLEL